MWDDFFVTFDLPLTSSDHLNLMEALIMCEEIGEAIDSLKANKSPGLDGLTAEFYKKFKRGITPSPAVYICCVFKGEKASLYLGASQAGFVPKYRSRSIRASVI